MGLCTWKAAIRTSSATNDEGRCTIDVDRIGVNNFDLIGKRSLDDPLPAPSRWRLPPGLVGIVVVDRERTPVAPPGMSASTLLSGRRVERKAH